jgi:hypothetical protein
MVLRLPRFGIRSIFVAVTLTGALLAVYARLLWVYEQEKSALAKLGAKCAPFAPEVYWTSIAPAWLDGDAHREYRNSPSFNCYPDNDRVFDSPDGHFRVFTRVSSIAIRGDPEPSPLRDTDIDVIAQFRSLDTLDVSGTPIDDDGVKKISNCQKLIVLSLEATNVTDAGLRFLLPLDHLRDLRLQNTHVSDAGVRELATLTQLRVLDVSRNPGVTDRSISSLGQFAGLQYVNLSGTSVTAGAVHRLRTLRPRLVVNY